MAEQPAKADIVAIFKRLRSIPTNKQCFDCGHSNPTWASITYGVFLCIDCSAVHRSLGVHVTFIRSTQLDTNWTWLQLRAMQVGGNANAIAFFRQHGCTSTDSQQKYHSRAAILYREKLLTLAQHATRLHGTKLFIEEKDSRGGKLHIGVGQADASPVTKEVDFFQEHTQFDNGDITPAPLAEGAKLCSAPQPIKNGSLNNQEVIDPDEGPSVEAALSMSPTQAAAVAEPRKVIIGGKKTSGAKKGKGLGAQKVKTNFNEIENRALQLDKEREELAKSVAVQEARTKEEQEKQMATMRLAYQDMSVERKKQEDKLKAADPKKAAQFERLGMGFAGNKGVSHSALSDMQTIQQERPSGNNGSRYDRYDRFDKPSNNRRRDFFEDEFEIIGGGFSSSSSRYDDSSYGSRKDDFSSWGNPNKGGSWDIDRFETKQGSSETMLPKDDDRPSRSRKTQEDKSSLSSSDTAQKRFGSAKGISSDQYFGPKDPDFEARQNLSRMEGKSSISSDDFFGKPKSRSSSDYNSAPDLQDIKDGVRQGVTKVAGKISSLANGVMSSLQN